MSVISVVLALGCFGLGVEALTRYRLDIVKIPVLVGVKTDRSLIEKDDVKMKSFPRKYIQEEVVLKDEDVVNHYVKLNHTLYPDMPIPIGSTEELDISHDDAILKLHKGQSVFALKTDLKDSFGGVLNVGHRVDLSVVLRQSRNESIADTFLKQVRIIGSKNKKGMDVEVGEIPAVILMAIDENALETLLKVQAEGDIVMTLVEKDSDNECVLVEGFTLE